MGWKPNHVTVLGFVVGLLPIICLIYQQPILGVVLLWLSGLLDAVDGAMARISGLTSLWGAFMDICFDRIVEVGVLLTLGYLNTGSRFSIMVLLTTILLSMTVFFNRRSFRKTKKRKHFIIKLALLNVQKVFCSCLQ